MPLNRHSHHLNYKDDWETPWEVFNAVQSAFNPREFTFDAAAVKSNAKCYRFSSDSLGEPWNYEPLWGHFGRSRTPLWWCNPPFSMKQDFISKAFSEMYKGHEGIMLLPASCGITWFTNLIEARPFLIWPRKIHFISPEGKTSSNTGGSVLISFLLESDDLPDIGFDNRVNIWHYPN